MIRKREKGGKKDGTVFDEYPRLYGKVLNGKSKKTGNS